MNTQIPRLSIGLPVYNGENYLATAIDSILRQSFGDFELIIADNASSDRTQEICRVFAAEDNRVRYLRQTNNLGAAANYNTTLAHARGEYFKWAAHDDVCLPGFLQACIDYLDHHPDTVLCHCRCQGIDTLGDIKGVYPEERSFDGPTAASRFWPAITAPHVCIAVFGVMRRNVLLKTSRHGDWVGADRNLLAELCLHGKLVLLPQYLFQRREHPLASIHRYNSEAERLAWFAAPGSALAGSHPTWRRLREYILAIGRSPLARAQKLSCYLLLCFWPWKKHHTGTRNIKLLVRESLPNAGGKGRPRERGQ